MKRLTGKDIQVNIGKYKPLGVSYANGNTNISIVHKGENPVFLLLYKKSELNPFYSVEFPKESRKGNILSIELAGFDIRGFAYNFKIGDKVFQDPYARRIFGREEFGIRKETAPGEDAIRCGFVDDFEAIGTPILRPYRETIVYGVHVRGFTKKLAIKNSGTFEGLKTRIPYLKELGVNYISLMPCYEFSEISEKALHSSASMSLNGEVRVNYWGYGKGNYFAVKEAYCATDNPNKEFYDFVSSFHENGLEIGMEIFFTSDTTPKFAEEVLLYWTLQYGVDGFRVYCDSACRRHLSNVPLLGRTKLIFENFDGTEDFASSQEGLSKNWKQIGIANSAFQSTLRSFLKGDNRKTRDAFYAMTANHPTNAIVNYMAGHDGFTLYDSLSYDYKHNEANGENNRDGSYENYSWNCGVEGNTRKKSVQSLRLKMLQNAFALLLLSQGTPYIYGGDEVCNSQGGNNNAWCQDNETGWITWKTPKSYESILPFVKKLIAFRKENPVFFREEPFRMLDILSCGYPDVSCHGSEPWRMDFENDRHGLGLLYCGDYVGMPGEGVYVVYNMYWEDQEFYLPKPEKDREWHLVIDTNKVGEEAFVEDKNASEKKILISPRSICVFKTRKKHL